jgi:hypothetical protein
VLDVLDSVITDHEGVDDDRRGQQHEGRDDVEETDAAVDERPLAAPGAGDTRSKRAARENERRKNRQRSE